MRYCFTCEQKNGSFTQIAMVKEHVNTNSPWVTGVDVLLCHLGISGFMVNFCIFGFLNFKADFNLVNQWKFNYYAHQLYIA